MKEKVKKQKAETVETRQKRSAAAGDGTPFPAKQHVQSVEHDQPFE